MDIVSGLSAASTAIKIAKDLRDIDRSIDDASFKLKIAELTCALADAKIALSEAQIGLADKDTLIRQLNLDLENLRSGEICAACGTGRMKKIGTSIPRMSAMRSAGVQEWEMKCDNQECGHTETKLHDPNGILKG